MHADVRACVRACVHACVCECVRARVLICAWRAWRVWRAWRACVRACLPAYAYESMRALYVYVHVHVRARACALRALRVCVRA